MSSLTPLRRGIALFALALGGFGIGVTEFATMGLLPDIARDLLPGFEAAPTTGIAHAGILITAYALGVVVGAPTFAVLAARVSQTKLTFWLLGLFIVGTIASACMPTFGSLAVFRFIAALPHGAYFGVASLLAARIMGPGKQGQGIALALSGLTIANVIGVPLATWLGQIAGWRWAYAFVAVIFIATLVLGLAFLPRYPGNPERSPARELSALRNPRIWVMIAVGSVGFGGFFAVYSYIAEVTTRVAGMSPGSIPWVLGCLGVGMTIGNFIGGWASDRHLTRTIVIGFTLFIAVLVSYSLLATGPVSLFALVFALGLTSSTLVPSIQARLIRISDEAALLGAAVNHAAFNIGNSLGAWLGGMVIAGGLGYLAPGWVGAALATLGLMLALISIGIERRGRARNLNTVGIRVV
ncbi:MFS transporter [Leucobacter luti]|uniref:DHA1 family inner membrane transport protein n=1 Tax=Leucobacter luti TaxID=340320 RepID=A0A4R6RRX6_9MICO|nr:MFS transporter [Leucobacter luti]MCW2287870.1 DHA1 family inner membrane transport protein [Leucobacter luti]QYM76129.1 MFS transporter [Leucobacter luti]TCK45967.1 DHA1 family inner membrane transport protein [Leucobacter luti]TDP89464.1 DHA1 family inner membrane transport protein [Leucobacter luti]